MPKCIIHAGMHKTGTTSIQHSLATLDSAEFHFAKVGRSPNHSSSIYKLFEAEAGGRTVSPASTGKPSLDLPQIRKEFKQTIREAGGKTLLISGERLLVMKEGSLKRLRRFLERSGYEVEIVAYVRSPASYMSSAYQQGVRGGNSRDFNFAAPYPKYRERFGRLDTVFGRDRVSLWKFEPKALAGDDVVVDFAKRLGIPTDSFTAVRRNETASKDVALLLFQYMTSFKQNAAEWRQYHTLGHRLAALLSGVGQTRFRLAPSLLQPVLDAKRDDIAWMEERLGQSLRENLGEDLPEDIRSPADLHAPVTGIEDQIRAVMAKTGIDQDTENLDALGMVTRIAEHIMRRTSSARGRPEPRAGGAPAAAHTQAPAKPVPQAGQARATAARPAAGKPASARPSPAKLNPRYAAAPGGIELPGGFLTRAPTPLVNVEKNFIVAWSPKSACTTTYVWFSHVSGFSNDVRSYASWPHKHRMEQYQKSPFFSEGVNSGMPDAKMLRIIRDPYGRAVSIYRHALQTHFADKDMENFSEGRISATTGYSFQTFLDMVSKLDMRRVDIHYRPQVHSMEAERKPDYVINISKQDLFTELNRFEADMSMPQTNFEDLNWLHHLESRRKAKQEPMEGDALDQVVFTRHQVSKLEQFPSYSQLLTPEAKARIEAIYKADFDAYRDHL